MHAHVVAPPFRFRCIEEGIYAGAYPTLRNLRFLKRLQLKTIISIIPEKPVSDLCEFCKNENITLHHFKAPKYKESQSTTAEQVTKIIEMLIDTRNHPIYIHCLDGCNVSANVIMALRKVQHFQFSSIIQEAKRYTGGEMSSEEIEFLKNWKGEIKVPEGFLPKWLWQNWWQRDSTANHPTVKLKQTNKKKKAQKSTRGNFRLTPRGHQPYKYYPPYIESPTLQTDSKLRESIFDFSRELDALSLENSGKKQLVQNISKKDLLLPLNVIEILEKEIDQLFDPTKVEEDDDSSSEDEKK